MFTFFINKFLGIFINNFTIVLTTFALFTKQNSYANWFYPFKMFSFINLDFFKKFLAIQSRMTFIYSMSMLPCLLSECRKILNAPRPQSFALANFHSNIKMRILENIFYLLVILFHALDTISVNSHCRAYPVLFGLRVVQLNAFSGMCELTFSVYTCLAFVCTFRVPLTVK